MCDVSPVAGVLHDGIRRCDGALRRVGAVGCALVLVACASYPMNRAVVNQPGAPSGSLPVDQAGPIAGVGVEGRDVVAMTERMVRSMLSDPRLSNRAEPPRIIVDHAHFINESPQPLNPRLITDRLRVGLNRAASGRMVFVARHHEGMVQSERRRKREHELSSGVNGFAVRMMGADYRLGGAIVSQGAVQASSGTSQRYTYISFEMVDLESGELVWAGDYEMQRVGQNDVIYY